MALTLGDNFSYQGAKPLDGRLKYDTLANMKAVADATMYDGCLAYCVATDKTYQWKSTNTVDTDTGRWREFSSGGGGGTSNYPDLTNKPSIEEIELVGNITADNLGLQKSSLSSSLKIDNVNRTTVQEALSALTTLTQPHEFTAFGNKSIDSDEYIPSVGNMEILYAKWETGSSPIPSPAFPLPNGWTTPLADMFYIIYMLRDKNDTYVDYECYAYYTYSSTNYVKLYARRATKSNDTWTFPS